MEELGGPLRLRTEDVIWREVGDELLVLRESTGTYLSLNATGKQLWQRLEEGATQQELVGWLAEEYGVPRDQAEGDVESFVASLRDKRLLRDDPA
jgi:hypothetical protein